jgi:hypothetical protein
VTLSRATSRLVALCALVALYAPTSIGGVISHPLYMLNVAAVGALLALVVLLTGRLWSRWPLIVSVGIVALPLAFTAVGEFAALSPGMAVLFGCTAMLFLTDVRDARPARLGIAALAVLDLVTLGLGTALVLDVKAADSLVKTYYAFFYPSLLPTMVDWYNKPVLTLATHSLAAFFYWLLFCLHLEGFRRLRSRVLLVLALWMLALCASLQSTTGVIFTAVGVVQLGVLAFARLEQRGRILGALVIVGLATSAAILFRDRVDDLVTTAVRGVLGHRAAGLLARYTEDGNLAGTLQYVTTQPWRPIGLTYSPALFYGDSGFVIYALRGSVLLPVFIYLGLYLWLRRNLLDRRLARTFWLAIVAFEIGFTPLIFFRFVGVLPFLLVWCNEWVRLGTPEEAGGATAASG